jgi:hypothetical protein
MIPPMSYNVCLMVDYLLSILPGTCSLILYYVCRLISLRTVQYSTLTMYNSTSSGVLEHTRTGVLVKNTQRRQIEHFFQV